MTQRIYTDTRINIDLCAWEFEQIAKEYLKALFGTDRELGGYTMTWDNFKTHSYASRELPQVDIVIEYKTKSITLNIW